MLVEFGNEHALEGYRDPQSDNPDLVRYRPLPGERVTTFLLPDDMGLQEAYASIVGAFSYHIEGGEKPSWIECDQPGLSTLLQEHYRVFDTERPAGWGKTDKATTAPKKTAHRRTKKEG